MSFNLPAPQTGCLLLADITGYTSYLQGTELDHAQDVLADLLENIVDTLEPNFTLSKLEGDAAFAYASSGSLNPSMLLDTVDACYFSFRRRLRDVIHATTCDCNACVLIPSLDLKFFVHSGQYVVRTIARSEELTGSDVVLVHRLLKGTAGNAVESSAYAVYTKTALDDLGMEPTVLRLNPHTETFDDIGEVPVFVQDLTHAWAYEQERNRDFVTKDAALYELGYEVPVSPAIVWNYMTDPAKRILWQQAITGIKQVSDGQRGVGTTNHCMHGPDTFIEHITDWRPFSHITTSSVMPGMPGELKLTVELEATDGGTKRTLRYGGLGPEVWDQIGPDLIAQVDRNAKSLAALLEKDLAEVT